MLRIYFVLKHSYLSKLFLLLSLLLILVVLLDCTMFRPSFRNTRDVLFLKTSIMVSFIGTKNYFLWRKYQRPTIWFEHLPAIGGRLRRMDSVPTRNFCLGPVQLINALLIATSVASLNGNLLCPCCLLHTDYHQARASCRHLWIGNNVHYSKCFSYRRHAPSNID